jgi:AraC-like DNA-binding protein
MPSLQLFFLIGNTVLLVLLAVILVKDHHDKASAILGAVLALSAAGTGMFAIGLEWEFRILEIPLNLLTASLPVAFWLLSKALFEDSFRWRWFHLLVYVLFLVAGLIGHYISFGDVLVVLGLYAALKDWHIDLVESRRRVRMVSVSIGGIMILGITAAEFMNLGKPRSDPTEIAIAGAFFVLILGICVRFLGFHRDVPTTPAPFLFPSQMPEEVDSQEGVNGSVVIDKLERLMKEDKIYREEGITIRRLADLLNVREYQLRRLINGHLGYRNFNSFLNQYRIEEVARQLVAPETRHLPVLSIALDMGYRSLSPFNKGFKEITGMTPTEFRKRSKPLSEKSDQVPPVDTH